MSVIEPSPEELPSLSALYISLVLAMLIGVILLFTVILPAERGIDITGIGERLQLKRMGQLKSALAEPDAPFENRPVGNDTVALTLEPGQGREVKMEMEKGFTIKYNWSTQGGPVAHDTHGDPYDIKDVYISYSLAESVEQDSGSITALYGGFHGWYWLNNGAQPVTVNLVVEGEYLDLYGHE